MKTTKKQQDIIDKIMDEILSESDSGRRFQLIQQLDLFSNTVERMTILNHEKQKKNREKNERR